MSVGESVHVFVNMCVSFCTCVFCLRVCENVQVCERVSVFGFEYEWVFGCRCVSE